jgi:hypothetical protein
VDRAGNVGRLTFALNVTLDGCCDHREMIADDELHDHFTQLIGAAGAMLYGRRTYELMEEYWAWSAHGSRHLDLVSTTRLTSGVTAMHYRRKEG